MICLPGGAGLATEVGRRWVTPIAAAVALPAKSEVSVDFAGSTANVQRSGFPPVTLRCRLAQRARSQTTLVWRWQIHLLRRVSAVLACMGLVLALTATSAFAVANPSANPGPAYAGTLTSATTVTASVSSPEGTYYSFSGSVGQHLAVAATQTGGGTGEFLLEVTNSAGNRVGNGAPFVTTGEVDFTVPSGSDGSFFVTLSPYSSSSATGSFSLVYAPDVTGSLTSLQPVTPSITVPGQQLDYTFTGVAGQHETVAVSSTTPGAPAFVLEIFDAAGDRIANSVPFTTNGEADFTVSYSEAGTLHAIVSPYGNIATGTFSMTFATDSTGTLSPGSAVPVVLSVPGQDADYTFDSLPGQEFTVSAVSTTPGQPAFLLEVFDAAGDRVGNSAPFTTTGTATFTVSASEAGPLHAVISPYGDSATGTLTLTLDLVVIPPTNSSPPTITGTPTSGRSLTCLPGEWANLPTAFAYQWSEDGSPIAKANAATYAVTSVDEGTTIVCTVSATNSAGSASSSSAPLTIGVPKVEGCPAATGELVGSRLGLVKLGETRATEDRTFHEHSSHGKQYEDFFCLTPAGIRVGYGSPKLLKRLKSADRLKLENRVVWASTSNRRYAIDGVRPGEAIDAAASTLHTLPPLHIGLNYWYLAVGGQTSDVLKVRNGIVQEIGIANAALTATARDRAALMHSFY